MNRRQFLSGLSGIAIGSSILLKSGNNSLATSIEFNDLQFNEEITEEKNYDIKISFDKFKVTPYRIGSDTELTDVKVRCKTDTTSFNSFESIYESENKLLDNNNKQNVDIKDKIMTVTFNPESTRLILEFIIETTKRDYKVKEETEIIQRVDYYAINDSNGVFIYNQGGDLIHGTSMSSGGGGSSEAAIVDRNAEFVITNDYRGIYCSRFNIQTGEEEWNVSIDTSNTYGLAFDVNTRDFYLGERSAGLGKYDKENGSRIWQIDVFSNHVDAITADANSNVYVADRDAYVYKISPDGDLIWQTGTDDSRLRGAIQSDPYGNLYSWGTSNFYKHDSDGNLIYKTSNINKSTRRNAFAIDRFGHIIADTGSTLRKLENDAETELWNTSLDAVANGVVVDWDGNIYAVDDDGRFYGYTPDGNERFKRKDGTNYGDYNYSNTLGGSTSNENLLYFIEQNDARNEFNNHT